MGGKHNEPRVGDFRLELWPAAFSFCSIGHNCPTGTDCSLCSFNSVGSGRIGIRAAGAASAVDSPGGTDAAIIIQNRPGFCIGRIFQDRADVGGICGYFPAGCFFLVSGFTSRGTGLCF